MQKQRSQNTSDDSIAVIGGGAIGLSIAWQLAKKGRKVTLFDRESCGKKASWASGGMIQAVGESNEDPTFLAFGMKSAHRYPSYVKELEQDAGMSVEYDHLGGLMLAFSREEEAHLREKHALFTSLGYETSLLTTEQMMDKYPFVSSDAFCGLFIPTDAQVDNRKLVEALRRAALKAGVVLREQEEVLAITDIEGGKVLKTSTGAIAAGQVIIAAGSWATQIIPKIRIVPIRGQMVRFRAEQLKHAWHRGKCIVVHHPHYAIPRRDDTMVVGSTVEEVGFDEKTTLNAIYALREAGIRMIPELAGCDVIEQWAGLRPKAEDGLPVIGRVDAHMVVALGHFRSGILLTPITTDTVVDAVTKGRYDETYSPARFL